MIMTMSQSSLVLKLPGRGFITIELFGGDFALGKREEFRKKIILKKE